MSKVLLNKQSTEKTDNESTYIKEKQNPKIKNIDDFYVLYFATETKR